MEDLLVYFLVFGSGGASIFFIGKASTTNSIHLAVFNLGDSTDLSISLAGPYQIFVESVATVLCPPDNKQALHPQYSLVAFTIVGSVYVWAYCAKDGHSQTSPILNAYPLDNPNPKARLWCCHHKRNHYHPDDDLYDSINFSEDGNHLILDGSIIIRLPEHVLAACKAPTMPDPQTTASARSQPSKTLSNKRSFSSFSDSLIRSAAYTIAPNGTRSGVSATASNGNIELQLWGPINSSGPDARLEVTALPDSWGNLKSATASFRMPKTKDKMMRIILNQAAQQWYDMAEPVDEHLPAVIARDVASVRMASESGVRSGDPTTFLLRGPEQGDLGSNGSSDRITKPPAKQTRRE